MKRQTFIKYYKYFTITVIFLSLTAFYSALIHYFPKDSLATDSPEGKRNITLIIDAGHGGEDGGAVGVGGSLEKDLNLIISQKLYNLLSLTEMNVVMTRHDDKMLYLENQKEISFCSAEENHFNYHGIQYVMCGGRKYLYRN